MKKRIITVFFSSLLFILMTSKTTFANGSFDVDYAVFYGNSDRNILEIYYSIPRTIFPWIQEKDGSFHGEIMAISTMFKMGEPIYRDTTFLQDYLPDNSLEHLKIKLSHQMTLQVESGDYAVSTQLYDVNMKLITNRALDINVRKFDSAKLELSDIEIVNAINKSDGNPSPFLKYQKYLVYPDAARMFSSKNNSLGILTEIYNLSLDADEKNHYMEKAAILDLNHKNILEYDSTELHSKGSMAIFIKNDDLSSLSSGIYFFKLNIKDLNNNSSNEQEKKIYFYNPDKQKNQVFAQVNYKDLNESQIDSVVNCLRPLFKRRNLKIYKKSNLQGKMEFLNRFWENHDPTPATIFNEYMVEIENRIAYANKSFSGLGNSGIISDQGRTLLKYGFPSDIQRYNANEENLPFQTWQYQNLDGGVIFIFADTKQIDYYELIHSTKKGELYNENWQMMIRPRNTIMENY